METAHSANASQSATGTTKDRVELEWNESHYPVTDLDEYTFAFQAGKAAEELNLELHSEATPATYKGWIGFQDQAIPVEFRLRRVEGEKVRMGFYDLPIKTREKLQRVIKQLDGGTKDELHELSYDDLATGATTKANAAAEQNKVSTAPKKASSFKKLIAMMVLAVSMLLVIGWVVYLVQMRSTVAVNNSVMVGNYMSINTPQQAQLVDVLVKTGQEVEAGQTLARLTNDEAALDLAMIEAKLMRARSEAVAYQTEAEKLRVTFEFAGEKVARDINVANAEMRRVDAELQAANAQLARLQPLLARGNVALAEFDEAKAIVATAEAEKVRQSAVIETLQFAKNAAKSEILVGENGASNPMGELETKISLAKAAIEELEEMKVAMEAEAQPIELTAPADGKVYAIYRQAGETLKVADEMLAVSANEGGWATGHVAAYLAPELKPGQPVEVEIPSLGITTTGTIEGIGHRSVYGRGGYNAEFRGGPLEVPIRVAIDLDGQPVPSGLRLHMTVRVRDHLRDMKNWFNEKVAWIKGEVTTPESDEATPDQEMIDLPDSPLENPVLEEEQVASVALSR